MYTTKFERLNFTDGIPLKFFFLFLLFQINTLYLFAQESVKIQATPTIQPLFIGETTTFNIDIQAMNGFQQQVYLNAISESLPVDKAKITFTPSIINYPYSGGINLAIQVYENADLGAHSIIIKAEAENGSVFSSDTIFVEVSNQPCKWNVRNNTFMGIYGKKFDRQGALWGFASNTLVKYANGTTIKYKLPSYLIPQIITSDFRGEFFFDFANNVWLSNYYGTGITKFDGTIWTSYNVSNSGILSDAIQDIAFGKDSSVWISSGDKGIVKFKNNVWTTFNTSNSGLRSNYISDIEIDKENSLWVAYEDHNTKLTKFDGTTWQTLDSTNSCLPSNSIWQKLLFSEDNTLWMTFTVDAPNRYSGILKYNNQQSEFWYTQTLKPYNHIITDDKCNVVSMDNNSGFLGTYTRGVPIIDKKGNLWLPSLDIGGWPLAVQKFDGKTWEVYNSSPLISSLNDGYDFFPQEKSDTIYFPFAQMYYYTCDVYDKSIKGKIYEDSTVAHSGTVYCINQSNQQSYFTTVNDTGGFVFNNLPKGKYILKAVPNKEGYITTFYPQKASQENAITIDPDDRPSSIDIHLLKFKNSIIGKIYEDSVLSHSGTVYCINQSNQQSYFTTVNDTGGFVFSNLPKGNYILKAVPNEEGYITTFYPQEAFQENALTIDLNDQPSSIDIHLLKFKNSITGKVYDNYRFVHSGTVYCINQISQESYSVTVNETGMFVFKNLPKGKYIVKAVPNEEGYVTTFYPRAVAQENAIIINLDGQLSDINISLQTIITGLDSESILSSAQISPNPFSDQITLYNIDSIEIFDLSGKLFFTSNGSSDIITTTSWPNGFYVGRTGNGQMFKLTKIK